MSLTKQRVTASAFQAPDSAKDSLAFQSMAPLDGGDRLGDGVLLDVEDQCGNPLDEAAVSGSCEGRGEALEQSLPEGPDEGGLPHGASPDAVPDGS